VVERAELQSQIMTESKAGGQRSSRFCCLTGARAFMRERN